MTRKRILFVDDEEYILAGLRDILRKERNNWDMVFALGAQCALAELEKSPFDVIVSDMRMPGMDGAALLHKVKQAYPSTARIVLSGQAERGAVVRALPVAHQFLSKPCDPDALRVVIERTCNLQGLLHDEGIRRVIGRLENLPSAPRSYWELTRAMGRDNIGLAEVAQIIEEDPAMSAKVLQLVNSAYFGIAQQVTSIQQAVTYLGLELIKSLALTAHVFAAMEAAAAIPGFSLDHLQKSSLLTARMARRLVSTPTLADEAFAAGMVHDIGKLILAIGLPDGFGEAVRLSRAGHRSLHEVELEILGVTHAEAGAYLLGVWGLPFTIVETVAYHHTPSLVASGERDVLTAVHAADALLDLAWAEEAGRPAANTLDIGFLESTGRAKELPLWQVMAREAFRATSEAA